MMYCGIVYIQMLNCIKPMNSKFYIISSQPTNNEKKRDFNIILDVGTASKMNFTLENDKYFNLIHSIYMIKLTCPPIHNQVL
jgi:hypothetical protein